MNNSQKPVILSFVGHSNSGKTSLITKIIPQIIDKGIRVGIVKHAGSPIKVDRKGKDSRRLFESGANPTMVCNKNHLAYFANAQQDIGLAQIAQQYFFENDLLLTEGFKQENYPKIEVYTYSDKNMPICFHDDTVKAIITDHPYSWHIPEFSFNDINGVVEWIVSYYLELKKKNNATRKTRTKSTHEQLKHEYKKKDNAIIQPVNRKKISASEPLILVSAESDIRTLVQLLDMKQLDESSLMMSTVFKGLSNGQPVSIIGPMIGAPYATLVLEEAIAAGVNKFLFFGQCGSLSKNVAIGDCIVPDGSFIDEGTSRCYPIVSDISYPDINYSNKVVETTRQIGQACHMGKTWCTDGLYQETPEKVRLYQDKHAIGVEMETSALFTVANYRSVIMAALLIVSDHLYSFYWQHGFGSQAYKQGLKKALQTICMLIKQG